MHKKILIMIIALFFLTFPVADAKENVVVLFSENFEGDLSRWYCDAYKDSISVLKSDEEYIGNHLLVKPGDAVAKLNPGAGYIPFSVDCSIYSQLISIDATKDYTFAVDFKSRDTQRVSVAYYNEAGEFLKNQEYTITPGSEDEWSCFSAQLSVPVKAAWLQIALSCRADRTQLWSAFYDNVIVCEGKIGFAKDIERRIKYAPLAVDNSHTVFEKENCVFVSTFENTLDDEWTHLNKKSEKCVKTTKDFSFTGRSSLFVNDELIETPVGIESKEFEILPGSEYILSFDAMNYIEKGATVHLRFLGTDGKLIKSESVSNSSKQWTNHSVVCVAPDDSAKAQVRIISNDNLGKNYIDNIKVILSKLAPEKNQPQIETEPTDSSVYDQICRNSIQLFVGSPNAVVNGEKTLIDVTNINVVAGIVDSRTLVPVRFIAENYGAEVVWEEATKTVTLIMSDKTVSIVLNKNEIKVNDKIIEIDVPAQSIEGRTMLPLRAFVEEVMNKTVFWDNRGLIVITDYPMLNSENDKDTIDALIQNISK